MRHLLECTITLKNKNQRKSSMDSFQLLLKYGLIVVGTILIPEGIMIAAYSDDYVFAIYSVWLVLNL